MTPEIDFLTMSNLAQISTGKWQVVAGNNIYVLDLEKRTIKQTNKQNEEHITVTLLQVVGGNIGTPLMFLTAGRDHVAVLEVSEPIDTITKLN